MSKKRTKINKVKRSNWRNIYKNYVLKAATPKELDNNENLEELIFENAPKGLYKYRKFNEHSIQNLRNNKVWLSKPRYFNDPYELKPYVNIDGIKANWIKKNDELRESLKQLETINNMVKEHEYQNNRYNEFENYMKSFMEEEKEYIESRFNEFKDSMCICAFNESKDSLLMWSHYTDSHKGFCIEYDFKEMYNHNKGLLAPVMYSNRIVDISKHSETNCIFTLCMLSKSNEWSYENEWRIICDSEEPKGMEWRVPKPKAIYLGCNMSEKHKNELSKIADELDIKKFVMQMKEDEFKLVPKEI